MNGFLEAERSLLEKYLPGLDLRLASMELSALESPGSPAVEWFREAGGAALLIPSDLQGQGASLTDGVRIQRALGARSPSLAVATTMHHFSVASLIDWEGSSGGLEWMLAEAVARNNLLIASGAAEGTSGSRLVRPTMTGVRTDGGFLINGSKKPCSLSKSMDLLFATVQVADPDGIQIFALAAIPADSAGLEIRPFWHTPILAGAQSDEVVLTEVFVPDKLVSEIAAIGATTDSVRGAMVWFELLVATSYVGAASALLERMVAKNGVPTNAIAAAAIELEGASLALEAVATKVDTAGGNPARHIGPALFARFSAQRAVIRCADIAVEALGGSSFVQSPDVSYLFSAVRCLAFHPPTEASAADSLTALLRGGEVSFA